MKQLKLLLMTCVLCAGSSAWAWEQTDVTSTYLTNPGFETSPIFDGTSLGASGTNATPTDGSTLAQTNPNVYNISGWTNMTTETKDYARTFSLPYNTSLYVRSNGNAGGQNVISPSNGTSVTTDNNSLLFVETNWCPGAVLGVKQTITLPKGVYKLKFDSYVSTSLANASSLCGVKFGSTGIYKWPSQLNTWTNNEVVFSITDNGTSVDVSMGYIKSSNVSGGNSAFLFVDNVKLYKLNDEPLTTTDKTSSITNPNAETDINGWTGSCTGNGAFTRLTGKGYDGKEGIFEICAYNDGSWSGYSRQEIKGLANGLYKVQVASMNSADVISVVVANDNVSDKLPAIGDKGGSINADGTETTLGSGQRGFNYGSTMALVTDGKLTIGVNACTFAQYQWSNQDNYTLVYYEGSELLAKQAILKERIAVAQDMVNGGKYIATEELATTIATESAKTESFVGADLDAAIASINTAIKNVKISNASLENPYQIPIKNGDMANKGDWEGYNLFSYATNNENPGANVTRPYFETWVAAPNTQATARKFYQTVAACPVGAYELKAAVTATMQTAGRNVRDNTGVYLYIKDGETVTRTACKSGNAAQYFSVIIDHATAGDLEIGLEIANTTGVNWIAFDNFSLTLYGNHYKDLAKRNYDAALAVAQATSNSYVIGKTEEADLKASIDAVVSDEPSSYILATNDLQIATINYNEAIDDYQDYDNLNNNLCKYASSTLRSFVPTKASEAAISTTVRRQFYESHAKAERFVGVKDCTSSVVNANFSDGLNGWTSSQSGGNLGTLNSQTWTNADDTPGGYYYDYYNGGANNQHATQTVTGLKPGTYILTIKARAQAGFYLKLKANETTVEVNEIGNSGGVFGGGWNDYTAECTVGSDGDLSIEVANTPPSNQSGWFGFGDVRLYRILENVTLDETATYTPEESRASITLNRTFVKGWNGLVLPFDLSTSYATGLFGADQVMNFSGISVDGSSVTLNFTENGDEIKAGKPVMIHFNEAPSSTSFEVGTAILSGSAPVDVEMTSGDIAYTFKGTYGNTNLTGKVFTLIQGDYFYNYDGTEEAVNAKTFRGYFENTTKSSGAKVMVAGFNFDGETTGIRELTTDNHKTDVMFDLMGRRVNQPTKGLFILNGKKVIKK